MKIQHKIQAGFAVSLVFLLMIGAIEWRSATENVKTFRSVDETYETLDQFERILVSALTTETAARGYVISGDETVLAPLRAGIDSIQTSLAEATRLTADTPAQQRRLDELKPLLQREIDNANEVVKLRGSGDTARARQIVVSGPGKSLMTDIRKLIGTMETEEEVLLQQRTAKSQAAARANIGIVALSVVLSLVLLSAGGVVVQRDFRKRLKAEEERDRFFMLSLDMLCISNSLGYFTRVSPAFTATLGWSVDELLRSPFLDLVHPDDRAATLNQVQKLVAGENVVEFENRYQHKDGSWRVLSWKSAPQPDGTAYSTARDVTKLKQAEESLRRSEERLAVTLNSIGDAVLVTDTGGRITGMNPVAEKLTGWPLQDAQGKPASTVLRLITEGTRKPATLPVDRVLETGQICALATDIVLISRDSTERPIADSAAPIRDRDGSIRGVVFVFRDVSEEKRAEREIRENSRQLRVLNEELEERVGKRTAEVRQALATLDATDDSVSIFDPETLRFTYVNEGAVRQFGYSREEFLAATPMLIHCELDESRFRGMLSAMVSGNLRSHRFTTMHRHKNGHETPVEINLQYVAREGEPPRFVKITRDITERQQNERIARRSQRLESLGTLAGGVAHDLNNALAPVMMGVELLKMQYPDASGIVDLFETSAKRGAGMVKQLLTFAKGAEGERMSIQPGHILKELRNIMDSTFPKNIRVEVRRDPDLPTVLGDATQIHQVLLNLCVNARDAMPRGGTIMVEARCKEVNAGFASAFPDAKPGKYVALSVQDTGTGIPPEILDRIFDPFFTTKGPEKGTGLGLSTVMGIVKGHGGFLQVQSQPGHGSTFTAYLPAQDHASDAISETKAESEFRGNGETVLVVDDDAAVREVAREVLRRLNFKALTATDGADGLMNLAEHKGEIRAIITDQHMPFMDGLSFVRALRRLLPDIPVIVASGRLDESEADEFNAAGVTLRLDKPFSEGTLAKALKNVLSPK